MNLIQLFGTAVSLGAEIVLNGDDVEISESASESPKLIEAIEFHKQEILAILQGKTVDGVGNCESCGDELVGLRTFDGYINRTCGSCGKWYRCMSETDREARQPVTTLADTAPAGILPTADSHATHGSLATI